MNKPLIKICGVNDPELAQQIARLGVDFIGLIFHKPSSRYVEIHQAQCIVKAAKAENIKVVAVFTEHSAAEMNEIATVTGVDAIQLHGLSSRQQHHLIPGNYQRFYVRSIAPGDNFQIDPDGGLQHCDPQRDFLLFDHPDAGHGQSFNWHNFQYNGVYRHGLAGGLTPANVASAIQIIQPALVDVSSGVENSPGIKYITLIQEFINAARRSHQEQL